MRWYWQSKRLRLSRRDHFDQVRDTADDHDPAGGMSARSSPIVSACDSLGTDRYTGEVLFRSYSDGTVILRSDLTVVEQTAWQVGAAPDRNLPESSPR